MDSLVSKAEKFNRRKQAQQTQASKLKAALDYERSSDASKKVQEQEEEVVALKAKLQKLEKQETTGRQARQDQEADLEEKVCAPTSVLVCAICTGVCSLYRCVISVLVCDICAGVCRLKWCVLSVLVCIVCTGV